MKKILATVLTLVLGIALLAGCSSPAPAPSDEPAATPAAPEESVAPSEAPQELTEVNVAYMPNYASLATVVAGMKSGSFEEQGIKVNLVEFADGPTIIAAMESGSIDFGYIGPGAHKLAIQGRAKIFALSQVGNADAVLGNVDKGVATAADLAGKTVAYASGTSSEMILRYTLEDAGLTMDDINAMEMDASAITTAMISGSVDACATWSPNTLTIMDELGDKVVKLSSNNDFTDRDVSAASWIIMSDYADENHDLLVRFTKGLYGGMDYRSKDENVEQNCQWVAEVTGLDFDTVYAQRGDAIWIDSQTLVDWVNSGKLADMYKVQQDSFIASGGVEAEVPVEDYVMFDIMTEAAE